MRLIVDIETNRVVPQPGMRSALSRVEFKRGDSQKIEIAFYKGTVRQSLAAGVTGKLGIKAAGDYTGAFLVLAESWTKETETAGDYYVFEPDFNTVALTAALDGLAHLDLLFEVEWSDSGAISSTNTLTARVHSDVIRGSEGTPVAIGSFEIVVPGDTITQRTVICRVGMVVSGDLTPAAGGLLKKIGTDLLYTNTGWASQRADEELVTCVYFGDRWVLKFIPQGTHIITAEWAAALGGEGSPDLATGWAPYSGSAAGVPVIDASTGNITLRTIDVLQKNHRVTVKAECAATLDPEGTATIAGAATLAMAAGTAAELVADGVNWHVLYLA